MSAPNPLMSRVSQWSSDEDVVEVQKPTQSSAKSKLSVSKQTSEVIETPLIIPQLEVSSDGSIKGKKESLKGSPLNTDDKKSSKKVKEPSPEKSSVKTTEAISF